MTLKEISTKQELIKAYAKYLANGGKAKIFSERTGVSRFKLYNLNQGRRFILDIDDAVKIAEGLGYVLKFEKK